jgi:hypothetical protein
MGKDKAAQALSRKDGAARPKSMTRSLRRPAFNFLHCPPDLAALPFA